VPRRSAGAAVRPVASLLAAVALFGSGCGTGGSRGTATSVVPLPPVSHRSEQYQNVLRPSLLFLGFDQAVIEENRLRGVCMRAQGWDKYPLAGEIQDATSEGPPPQLSAIQTVDERLRVARSYGTRVLSPPADSTGLAPFQEFADWLHRQSDKVRHKYTEDASSCKEQALKDLRLTIPGSVPAVEARAGQLYEEYVTRSGSYRRAERAWRACMRERGFPQVGEPLDVWNQAVAQQLDGATHLSARRKARLARVLTEQAVAEHECAVKHLDDVVRKRDLRVVQQLVKEFPEYRRLITK
jgi:hypothetical protein